MLLPAFMFDAVSTMGAHIRQGKLDALAVTGARRTSLLPDVPSILELGYRKLVANAWAVVLAPAGTPEAAIRKLSAELAIVLRNPELQADQHRLVLGLRRRLVLLAYGRGVSSVTDYRGKVDARALHAGNIWRSTICKMPPWRK